MQLHPSPYRAKGGPPMTAVIYARYSSDNQREESVEGQIRNARRMPKRMALCRFDSKRRAGRIFEKYGWEPWVRRLRTK